MPDPRLLVELAHARMPFGRYEGRLLCDLPQAYLVWLQAKGWPHGRLGQQLAAMLELDHNGLKHLLEPLR